MLLTTEQHPQRIEEGIYKERSNLVCTKDDNNNGSWQTYKIYLTRYTENQSTNQLQI